jgi:hypothetical protein
MLSDLLISLLFRKNGTQRLNKSRLATVHELEGQQFSSLLTFFSMLFCYLASV